MQEVDLKKLNRAELLTMLMSLTQRCDDLELELAQTKEDLTRRQIEIGKSGTMAEAAMRINRLFEDADKAARMYLENIRFQSERQGAAQSNRTGKATLEEILTSRIAESEKSESSAKIAGTDAIFDESAEELAEAKSLLEAAQSEAKEIRERVAAEAAAKLEKAEAQATEALQEAKQQAAAKLEKAEAEAVRLKAESESACQAMEKETKKHCSAMIRQAKEQSQAYWDEVYERIQQYVESAGPLQNLLDQFEKKQKEGQA